MTDDATPRIETVLIGAGRPPVDPGGPLNVPITPASALHPGGEVGYARAGSPAWTGLEQAIGALEGGEAVAFASGMAATSAAIGLCELGATVVAPRISYQQTRTSLQAHARSGRLALHLVDVTDTPAVLAACDGADVLWLESPTNPLLGIADLPALCEHARAAGILTVVDNTLATPLGQRPLGLGADLVIHSATKAMGGHSDLLLGAAVARDPELVAKLRGARSDGGATPGALEVFLCLRGLRTLALRFARAQDNAAELARRLVEHPDVEQVRWPGSAQTHPQHERAARVMDAPGFMLTFSVTGGAARADAMLDALTVLVHATSLGGVETTLERRARYPDERDVPDNLLRVSIGCEHVEDLWADLERALEVSRPR